jgi:RimJ/RimL family protein N-acetyltransferase
VAIPPPLQEIHPALLRLERFDPAHADLVASWVTSELEAYWLAPQTPPPLTADQVRRWSSSQHEAFQLRPPQQQPPIAYGELNILDRYRHAYWLGHLIVDPAVRGRGVGRELTRRLIERARTCYGATEVTLVVFPANAPAIRCYRAAGLLPDGYELHDLEPYGHRARLLRMSIRFF